MSAGLLKSDIIDLRPTIMNICTRFSAFYSSHLWTERGGSRPPQMVPRAFIIVGRRLLVRPFLRMYKTFEYIKEQIIRFQLFLVPFGVYVTLYASQNLWAAYVAGAVILVILTSYGLFGKTFTLYGQFSKPSDVEYSSGHLAGLLIMYTILFLTVLVPLALYIQGEYDVKFLDKKTYHYYTSYDN